MPNKNNSLDRKRAVASKRVSAAASISTGALPSNTAPSNCTENYDAQILRCGIDSLYLSYPGQLSDEAHIRLEQLKALAQSKDRDKQALAQYEAAGHLLEVKDRGSHPYKYLLRDNWFFLKVSGLTAARVPLVHAQIASHALTLNGPLCVEDELNTVVKGFGRLEGECTVGRADLCVDFVTKAPFHEIQDRDWVSRARGASRHTHKRRFSGYSIGLGGQLSARLYDKTLEIEVQSHKTYLYDLWYAEGWDGVSPVWRLEFQFRRDALRGLSVATFPQLMNQLGGLWAYACRDWLRLTCPSPGDKTQTRWPTHPVWAALQTADWGTEPEYQRVPVDKSACPSDKYLFENGLSGFTSYMAREGYTDWADAAPAYFNDAREFHNAREYFTHLSFEEYIEQKVALKARQYGTLLNLPRDGGRHPSDLAVAREYRRRSNGE